jgi:hypothetical protein
MAIWRMAFRQGVEGVSLWPECQRLGVAAIEYHPVLDVDFSQYNPGEPQEAWAQLGGPQHTSLSRFVYDMQPGDIIYVKEGRQIVGRGVVTSDYQFDHAGRIRDEKGHAWQHQRRVSWCPDFQPVDLQIGQQQIMTLVPLAPADVVTIEDAAAGG